MTYVYLYFALPALVAIAVLIHRLVQVQFAEPVETAVLDRTSIMKRLLSKAAGAGLMLMLMGCQSRGVDTILADHINAAGFNDSLQPRT